MQPHMHQFRINFVATGTYLYIWLKKSMSESVVSKEERVSRDLYQSIRQQSDSLFQFQSKAN